MDLCRGRVVKAKAGRDKNQFFVVVDFDDSFAFICDGRRRKLLKPKKKNIKHLALTAMVLLPEMMTSDKKIKSNLNNVEKI